MQFSFLLTLIFPALALAGPAHLPTNTTSPSPPESPGSLNQDMTIHRRAKPCTTGTWYVDSAGSKLCERELEVFSEKYYGGDRLKIQYQAKAGTCVGLPDNWQKRVQSMVVGKNTYCTFWQEANCSGRRAETKHSCPANIRPDGVATTRAFCSMTTANESGGMPFDINRKAVAYRCWRQFGTGDHMEFVQEW